MRSRPQISFNFGSYLHWFGCHGNSLGSLEILDSIFEIADPENHTIHAKFVSISSTGMKLCLFECLAYLYHCGYLFKMKIVHEVHTQSKMIKKERKIRKKIKTMLGELRTANVYR